MASITPTSTSNNAQPAVPDTASPIAQAATLPPAHSPEVLAATAVQRARRHSHPGLENSGQDQHAPNFLHGFKLRAQSLANVEALFNGVDDMSEIGRAQDQQLAQEICQASQIALPANIKANDCVVLPPDVMAYWVRHGDEKKKLYRCPEINGTGFGGIAAMPPEQFREMMNTHRDVARQIMDDAKKNKEQPLLLVANSGREGADRTDGVYPETSNSKMIWEKAHVAERYALEWSNKTEPNHPMSLDQITTPYYQAIDAAKALHGEGTQQYAQAQSQAYLAASAEMAKLKDKPLVLLGYSRDVAAVCRIEDGRAILFGRPVNGLLNDRAAENLNMVQQGKLDYKKMALINSTVDEGVNKFEATLARAEFANSPQAKELPRIARERGFEYDVQGLDKAFHYTDPAERGDIKGMSPLDLEAHYSTFFRSVRTHDGLDEVKKAYYDFLALGHDTRPLFKPNGTGQAKGIIGVRHGESWNDFEKRFKKNQEELKRMFGEGAGDPYQVELLCELERTPEGENQDFRFVIEQSRKPALNASGRLEPNPAHVVQAFNLLWKKEPATETARSGPVEFAPTNITAAVAKTGRPANDFAKPLCTKQNMEESGIDEKLSKSMSLYFSAFYAFLLENRYPRPAQVQPARVEAGGVLPFSTRSASPQVSGSPVHGTALSATDEDAQTSLSRSAA